MRRYDPESLGARCSECFLRDARDGDPVPPECNTGSKIVAIGEAPGGDEVLVGRPFVGAAGRMLDNALSTIGHPRSKFTITNCLQCRPPDNKLAVLMNKLKNENKKRAKEGLPPRPTPMQCCRPRLVRELRNFDKAIVMGKTALQSVIGGARSIFDLRGAPMDGVLSGPGDFHATAYFPQPGELVTPLKLVPTLHPSFVCRQKRWSFVLRADLARAMRWFTGTLNWKEPEILYNPSPAQLKEFLYSGAPFYAYDVETDAKESIVARLRCIGFATMEKAVVVGLLSIDGYTRFYAPDEEEEILDILRVWFTDRRIVKTGHNAGVYDRIVVEQHLGVTPVPLVDTMIMHHSVDSELPHTLGFVGSVYTDVTKAWKADHAATEARTDFELHEYNATDCVVNARILPPLVEAMNARHQNYVVEIDHRLQDIAAQMHINGIWIDQERRLRHAKRLREAAALARLQAIHASGNPNFNPNSSDQVRELLYEKWAMTPVEVTKLNLPSTGDSSLRKLLQTAGLPEYQRSFLEGERAFRKYGKLKGTFIDRMQNKAVILPDDDVLSIDVESPEGAASVDEDYDIPDPEGVNRKDKRKIGQPKTGLLLNDGRAHSNWNVHVAVTGRFSSSAPNMQNIPRPVRDMICAEEERMLVAADMDQLELRYVAAVAGAAWYLEVFDRAAKGDENADPHAATSEMLYGKKFTQGSKADKKRIRDFAKRFSYAVIYGALIETVHDTIASAENDKGQLIFPDVTLRETRLLYDKWLKANPEIERWWSVIVDEYRAQGYLIDKTLGRRRDFADGEDRNEILNFPIQCGGVGVVHLATFDFVREVPFGRWGPGTGLIQQGHDALMAEVPEKEGKRVANIMQECMTRRVPGVDVPFTAKAKFGRRWSEME